MIRLEDLKYRELSPRPRNRIEAALGDSNFLPKIERPREPEPPAPKPKKFRLGPKARSFLLVLISLMVIFSSYYIYREWQIRRGDDPERVIALVRELTDLPANESPTVATVTDLEPLWGQPFFAQAQIGDKILIFEESKKAILYRPSTDKIIVIAPIK